jgi:hypothetical protein
MELHLYLARIEPQYPDQRLPGSEETAFDRQKDSKWDSRQLIAGSMKP